MLAPSMSWFNVKQVLMHSCNLKQSYQYKTKKKGSGRHIIYRNEVIKLLKRKQVDKGDKIIKNIPNFTPLYFAICSNFLARSSNKT